MSKNIEELKKYKRAIALGLAMASAATVTSGLAESVDEDWMSPLYSQESTFTPVALDCDATNDNISTYTSYDDAVDIAAKYVESYPLLKEWPGDLRRDVQSTIYVTGLHLITPNSAQILRAEGIIENSNMANKNRARNIINRILYNNTFQLAYASSPSELVKDNFMVPTIFIESEVGIEVSDSIFDNLFETMVETKATVDCDGRVIKKPDLQSMYVNLDSSIRKVYMQLNTALANFPNVYAVMPNERWFINMTTGTLFKIVLENIMRENFPELTDEYYEVDMNGNFKLKDKKKRPFTGTVCLGPGDKMTDEQLFGWLSQMHYTISLVIEENGENEINTELGIKNCGNQGFAIYDGNTIAVYGDGDKPLLVKRLDDNYELLVGRRG